MSNRIIDDRPAGITMTQLAYSPKDAARQCGVSLSHFSRHVRPELPRPVFTGGRLLFKHADLVRWLEKQ